MAVRLQLMPWITVNAVITLWWFMGFFIFMRVVTVNHMRRDVPIQYPGEDLNADCTGDETGNQGQSCSFWRKPTLNKRRLGRWKHVV